MRIIASCVAVLVATACFAADLTTLDGKIYQNIKVTRVDLDGIYILHSAGGGKIRFTELPEDVRTQYGYDPAKLAAIEKEKAQAVAAKAQAAAAEAQMRQHYEAINETIESDSSSVDKVKTLLKTSTNLTFTKPFIGWSPLHAAAKLCKEDMITLLIDSEADVNAKDQNGCTPLHWVSLRGGRPSTVKLLLANKADINAKDDNGWTALHMAAVAGHEEVGAVLLASKCEVNARDHNGHTPLYWAGFFHHESMANLLRRHGAQDASSSPLPQQPRPALLSRPIHECLTTLHRPEFGLMSLRQEKDHPSKWICRDSFLGCIRSLTETRGMVSEIEFIIFLNYLMDARDGFPITTGLSRFSIERNRRVYENGMRTLECATDATIAKRLEDIFKSIVEGSAKPPHMDASSGRFVITLDFNYLTSSTICNVFIRLAQ